MLLASKLAWRLGQQQQKQRPTDNALLINFGLSSEAEIFVNKHRLSIQNRGQNVLRRVCNAYVFRLSFHFACHRCWLGSSGSSKIVSSSVWASSLLGRKSLKERERKRGGPILTPLLCIMPFTGCPKVGRGGKTLLTLPAGLCGGWGGGGRLGSADHTQRRQGRREGGSLFSLLHFCVGGGKKCKKEGDCNFARSKGGGKHEEETERLLPFIDRDATGNRHGMTTTHPTTQKKSKVGLHLESR